MATILELAQMCDNVYEGTPDPLQNTAPTSPLLAGLSTSGAGLSRTEIRNLCGDRIAAPGPLQRLPVFSAPACSP